MRNETKSVIIVALLGLLTVILKASGVLGISWLLALLPFWLPLAVFSLIPTFALGVLSLLTFIGFWGFVGHVVGKLFGKSCE